MALDIVALGELLIDFTTTAADESGYPTLAAHPGGAPANFLAAAAAGGARTALLGKVGTDVFGELLCRTLQTAGIDTRGVLRDEAVFTTLAFVTLDETGDRSFSFARKPGADTCLRAQELNTDLLAEARALHFGTLSLTHEPARTATQKAVALAKAQGKLITCDPNLRPPLWADLAEAKRQIQWALAQADVVKLSDVEAEFLFGAGVDLPGAAQRILTEYGVKLVFLTCGAQGCLFATRSACGRVPALPGVQPVDTTGAGDIFGGTAVWQLLCSGKAPEALTEEELRRITAAACAAAGLSTQKAGGISSVPTAAQLAEALQRYAL